MKGKMTYGVMKGDRLVKVIRLTVCCEEDYESEEKGGLSALRRRRIHRLMREAERQGARLTQGDLALILSTSRSTIKRDMITLKREYVRSMKAEKQGRTQAAENVR